MPHASPYPLSLLASVLAFAGVPAFAASPTPAVHAAAAAPAAPSAPAAPAASPIDAARFARDLAALASDAFAGRGPASPGEETTVAYLAAGFKAAGLEPGGEAGGWTQAVPMLRTQVTGPVEATLKVAGAAQSLLQGDDLVLQTLQPVDRVDLHDVPLVFVGYGIHAPERGWDDFKGVDLHGKIAVVLVNDPDFETPAPGKFDGRAITWYGRWVYKYEEAAKRGATGVLIVHEDKPAAYGWATVRNGGVSPQFDLVRDDPLTANLQVRGWIQRPLAVSLFQRAGLDFEAAKHAAQREDFRPVALGDATLSTAFAVTHDRITSRNVLARLPGAKRPNETVFYGGHWDHFGVGRPDADGDAIYNGAVDNATALAAMLELARAFAAGPRPDRSVVFFAPTAEEKGLLGSAYYAAHPLYPLATTAAVINIEMLSPDGPNRDIASWGRGRVSLEGDLARVAAARGRTYSPDENLEAGFFYRADHFSFARAGVPAITVGPGSDHIPGGKVEGKRLRDKYFAERYHQPTDEYDVSWDTKAQADDVSVLYDLGQDLANRRDWPQWEAGSEFRAIREASASSRK